MTTPDQLSHAEAAYREASKASDIADEAYWTSIFPTDAVIDRQAEAESERQRTFKVWMELKWRARVTG